MIDRRSFLQMMGIGGISALNMSKIAQTLFNAPHGAFLPSTVGRDPITHVINRLTYGITPSLYQHVQAIGATAFIEEQLNPNLSDAGIEARLAEFPLSQKTSAELFEPYREEQGAVSRDFLGTWFTYGFYSERQLYQRMVEFWSDHFYVYLRKFLIPILKIDDDRALRPLAFGKFRDLLGASAKSPAMLFYLDNALSQDRAPNENYGRELLELHTLGVNGGYTEQDVKEVARAFTGWSIPRPEEFSGTDLFLFRQRAHDDEEKIVLGNIIPAGGGIEDGEMVLDILASHPSTARFISKKLARRFVSDNPSDELVEQLATVFTETGGDSHSLLQTIFASDEFWNAPPKFKRPYDYTLSLLRALDMQITNPARVIRLLNGLLEAQGQIPFNWSAPNGYPDVGTYWMNNLLPRWNAVLSMVNPTRLYSPNFDVLGELLTDANLTSIEGIISFWGNYLFGRELTDAEMTTLYDFSLTISGDIAERAVATFVLCLASPAFQYK